MRSYIFFVLSFFLLITNINGFLYAQSDKEASQKLEEMGITSEEQIKAELEKRGMTVDDARNLAAMYGIDYDSFIKEYIMTENQTKLTLPPTVIKLPETTDTTEKVLDNPNITDEKDAGEIVKEPGENNIITQENKEEGLSYFGYNIFESIPSSFEPAAIGPIDPGYLLGPGDVLNLTLWGNVEFQYELRVNDQGNIFIPTAGQVFVLGVPYSELKNKLTAYLSQFYEGLTSDPPTIFLDVSLSGLSPLRVFALGEVRKPGGYNISSFSTVFNVLYSIGGPLTSGSLRDVRVIRNNKLITSVDLYDYLLKGQLIGDIRLQNNDIVFIPPRLKTVSIEGEILRPAKYELKSGEGIKDLIYFAGGLKSTAYTGRIQINRIIPFEQRKEFSPEREYIDINLSEYLKQEDADFALYDGDKVTIFPILEEIKNYVVIEGAVYRPGTYEFKDSMHLSELISKSYGLLPEAYLGKADITRIRPNKTQEFISVELSSVMSGNSELDIALQPRDKIKIYSIYDLKQTLNVSIGGYVKNPLTIPYADSLTVFDLIFMAGGLQDPVFKGQAFTARGDIIRLNSDRVTTSVMPFNLEEILNNPAKDIDIEPGDKVIIYNAEVENVIEQYVTIEGEVRNPGQYRLDKNMTPVDLILRAGGFLESSLRNEVYVNRINAEGYPGDKLSESFKIKIPGNFDKKNESLDFILQHKDVVVVRKNPEYEHQRFVKIYGEITYPGVYVLNNKNETVLDLIREAGGPTSEAYLFGTYFSRANERLIVNLEDLIKENNLDENVLLREDDSLYIPKRPNSVFISGEVNNEGIFKFVEGETVSDYINKAGGLTNKADYAIYSKPNGESIRVDFGLFSSDPEVFDGSIIRIAALPTETDTESIDWGRTITDVFAIASSVLTILVLASKL